MKRNAFAVLTSAMLAVSILGCSRGELSGFVPPAGKYDVRILRDTWGIPHIFGKRDADAAYGLAYAHCQDDWANIEDSILVSRGLLASARGKEWAKFDYVVQWFQVRKFVDEKYEKTLGPELRAVVEAYADGITHYAALNRKKMPHIELPVTGKDVVAGAALKAPFFYDLQDDLENLFGDGEGTLVGRKGDLVTSNWLCNPLTQGLEIGSNAWAIAPNRSADGATRIAINSHMPWTGPLTWYEAHVHSDEGWNMIGGTFPGGPMIFKGHDENKAWTHTINRPDLADIYRLDINPDNPDQYRFDGEWKNLQEATARIRVRLWGPFSWTFKREMLWSVHGPAVRRDDGTVYALRFVGYGEIGQLEQWFRMNKARNLEEFLAAMRTQGLTSLNTVYADKSGNIYYAYVGKFPVRREGYSWKEILPGNTSETFWNEFYPFEKVPQVLNPPSGFLQSCNNSPFQTTDGEGNPKPADFPESMGIETHMTNRGLRALEVYGGDPSITHDEFFTYKYDKTYSDRSARMHFIARLLSQSPPEDGNLRKGYELIKAWDHSTEKESTAAALAIVMTEHFLNDAGYNTADPMDTLRKSVDLLMSKWGRLDVRWEDTMRLRRGSLDLPLSGGPDCLRALDVSLQNDGRFMAVNGDCYFLMTEWGKDGRLSSAGIHQFGAASTDENSPHYADQAPLFAEEKTRPTLLDEKAIREHLEKEYRPGEIPEPWYSH